jgi:hypothetical protein
MRMIGPRGEREVPKLRVYIPGAATTLVKSGAGRLAFIIVGRSTAAGTIVVYDSLVGAGTILADMELGANQPPVAIPFNAPFNIGLTVVTTSASKVAVIYD